MTWKLFDAPQFVERSIARKFNIINGRVPLKYLIRMSAPECRVLVHVLDYRLQDARIQMGGI